MKGFTSIEDLEFRGLGWCLEQAHAVRILILSRIGTFPEMQERSGGGFLCIADKKGQPRLVVQVGKVPEEKLGRYYRNALEKALRLSFTHKYGAGHYLSRQSKDEVREQWSGAVAGDHFILSFSGFPEDVDEIYMLLLAIQAGEMTPIAAEILAKANKNDYYSHFKDLFAID